MYNYQVFFAPVAQWIEHLSSEQGVVGSTPAGRAVKQEDWKKPTAWLLSGGEGFLYV